MHPKQLNLPSTQQGVALIAVLLFLILITIVGVIAVRQASTDLRVATADQAQVLMHNASDSVIAHIEEAANQPGEKTILNPTKGIIGYYIYDTINRQEHQIGFCYRPSEKTLFNLKDARILLPNGGFLAGTGGKDAICNPETASHYGSGRNTVMTQVLISGNIDNQNARHTEAIINGEGDNVSYQTVYPNLKINATSVLPAMSAGSASEINACLGEANALQCLQQHAIAHNAITEEVVVRPKISGGYEAQASLCKGREQQCQEAGIPSQYY